MTHKSKRNIIFIGTQLSPNMMNETITQLNTNYRKIGYIESIDLFKQLKEEDFKIKINDFGVRKSLSLYLIKINNNLKYEKYNIEKFQKHSYIYTESDEVYIFRLTKKIPTWKIKEMKTINPDLVEIWKLEKLEVK